RAGRRRRNGRGARGKSDGRLSARRGPGSGVPRSRGQGRRHRSGLRDAFRGALARGDQEGRESLAGPLPGPVQPGPLRHGNRPAEDEIPPLTNKSGSEPDFIAVLPTVAGNRALTPILFGSDPDFWAELAVWGAWK